MAKPVKIGSMLWCSHCGSWHIKPKDAKHAKELQCFNPKWPHNKGKK